MTKYLSNPALPTILKDWQGNPVSNDGRFFFPGYPFTLGWADVLKWKSMRNPYEEQKKRETWRAKVIKDDSFLHHDHDVLVWLGHASFFFRLNGLNILVDPVLGKLSPLMPRYTEFPVDPGKFQGLDFILVTHNHRDHCDDKSLRFLMKNNRRAKVITGLGMQSLLAPWSGGNAITEMGWFQCYENEAAGLKITYLPSRHWSRRWLMDTNRRLWGAFMLQTNDVTLYFGGDSGYGNHYRQLAELYPTIDYAILGIGAFAPEWFMHSNHMSPSDAWQAFQDMGAGRLVPMHYGTFDLSDEPLGEPERLLKNICAGSDAVEFPLIGEVRKLQPQSNPGHLKL